MFKQNTCLKTSILCPDRRISTRKNYSESIRVEVISPIIFLHFLAGYFAAKIAGFPRKSILLLFLMAALVMKQFILNGERHKRSTEILGNKNKNFEKPMRSTPFKLTFRDLAWLWTYRPLKEGQKIFKFLQTSGAKYEEPAYDKILLAYEDIQVWM